MDVTPIPKHTRIRSKAHLAFIGSMRCVVPGCGRRPVQVHHLLSGPEPKGRGVKASDTWTIPLCLYCHTALHACGDETAWARRNGFNVVLTASALWGMSPANKGG
jgi:hypothetical protein